MANVWQVFNPDNEALVHIWIGGPSLVTFKLKHEDELNNNRQNGHRSIWSSQTFKPFTEIDPPYQIHTGLCKGMVSQCELSLSMGTYVYYLTLPVYAQFSNYQMRTDGLPSSAPS